MKKFIVALAAVLSLVGCGGAVGAPKPTTSAPTTSPTTAIAAAPSPVATSSLCDQLVTWRDAGGGAQFAAVGSSTSTWSSDAKAGNYATVTGADSVALAKAADAALSNPPPGPSAGPYVAAMTYISSAATDAESASAEPLSEQAGSITAASDAFQNGISQLEKVTTDISSAGCD